MAKRDISDDWDDSKWGFNNHGILDDESCGDSCSGPNFFSGVIHPSEKNKLSTNQDRATGRELVWPSKRLSDVVLKALNWLWRGFLPIGKIVCVYGIGGVGKTTVMIDLVARLTTGLPFPDGSKNGKIGTVVFITGEDGVADTILPR